MKKLIYILMFVTLGVAMSCEEDPNPAKRYIDLYVDGKLVKAELLPNDGTTEPPPEGADCDSSNLCCWGSPTTGMRCRQY